jgi:hypothetical protein
MNKPNRIFFTGAPGSRWSCVAQKIEAELDLNISDRTSERTYSHSEFSGHVGAYFGTGMEFPAKLDDATLDAPYADLSPGKLHKSHEWAYMLEGIKVLHPDDAIFLIYRPTQACFDGWKQAGGWRISYPDYNWYRDDYPDYNWYQDDKKMFNKIDEQNRAILKFGSSNGLTWQHVAGFDDILIAFYTPGLVNV